MVSVAASGVAIDVVEEVVVVVTVVVTVAFLLVVEGAAFSSPLACRCLNFWL